MPLKLAAKLGEKNDANAMAIKHWHTIRKKITKQNEGRGSLHDISESVTHGIYKTINLPSEKEIKSVTHNLHSGQYLVLHEDGEIEIYLKDGSKEKGSPTELLSGIVYASKPMLYATWNSQNIVKLLNHNFEEISSVQAEGAINCMLYNEYKNEVITSGQGAITVWFFRMNNTILVPRLRITEHLGPADDIKIISLEPTSSKYQRLFAVVGNAVVIFRVKDGSCVFKMPDLHRRAITDFLFYQPLQIILTSAEDGSIKLWDESGNLRSVFIGHTLAVTCLSACQRGALVLSGSLDGSIKLWNVDTNEEVESIESETPIKGICKRFGEEDFFTFTKETVTFWKLNNLYDIFTIIGSKARALKNATNPTMPSSSFYICDDGCIRIVCPKNGNVVTVMMSPQWRRIKDAVYAIKEGYLFTLLRDGTILKCSTKTNPCKIEESWTKEDTGAQSNCTVLCLFEHVLLENLIGDQLQDFSEQQQRFRKPKKLTMSSEEDLTQHRDRTLLIGGCEDGNIVVFKWRGKKDRGKISFSIEAHKTAIVAIASNPDMNQIASCCKDNSVRIWRVFPFAQDALAPLMFIMNPEPATHLVYSRHRLCIALQDPYTAAYNITMFKTTDTEPIRIEHNTDVDHVDSITAVCCCQKMNLFASASIDGNIKIWNEHNKIVRIIKLHTPPVSLCFCTQRGDLLVGIGEHVHKISYEKYMPERYMKHMVVMNFDDPRGVDTIEPEKDVLELLDDDQKHRLTKARSSAFFVAKFVDIVPQDELEEREKEKRDKDLGVTILKQRDDDINKIRDGEIPKKKKPPATEAVREEAWKKYLDIFYKRPAVPPIRTEAAKDDEEDYTPLEGRDNFQRSERGNTDFFSISTENSYIKKLTKDRKERETQKKTEMWDKMKKKERSQSLTSDIVTPVEESARPLSVAMLPEFHTSSPYSLLRRILSAPPKMKVPKLGLAGDIGPKHPVVPAIEVPPAKDFPSNFETLRNLNRKISEKVDAPDTSFNANRKESGMLPVAPDGYLPNSVIVALYKELRKEEPVKEEKEWKCVPLTQEQLDELEAFYKRKRKQLPAEESSDEKLSSVVSKQELPESPTSEKEIDIETPPPTPPRTPSPEPSPEPVKIPKPISPPKPIQKFVSRIPIQRTPTPAEEPPPPPRPVTPLPGFITQFKGQEWFDKYFPNATPELFPKPWTIDGFAQLLLSCLQKEQDYGIKTQICAAIMVLQNEGPFLPETCSMIQNVLLVQLNPPIDEKTTDTEGKNHFIKLCLKLLASLGILDPPFMIELMAQYITGDTGPRLQCFPIFQEIGLQDPHDYFKKELNTFTTYGVFDQYKKKQAIKQQCKEWLEKWTKLFKEHIASLTGKIYRANKGNVVRGTKSPKADVKRILHKDKKDSSGRKVSFVPDDFINDAANNAKSVDAINYFCEMKYEEEVERARRANVAPREETARSDRLRNTVVILPKLDGYRSLARLGETHKSCCHPERETALAYDLRLPRIEQSNQDSYSRGLLLHVNKLTLNPFPSLLDELLYEPFANSSLVTLRSAPKYFIPSNSYVEDFQM